MKQRALNLGELVADIRERVLYMHELGVTDLNVQLAEMPIAQPDESRTQIASYTPQACSPISPSATKGNATEIERPAGSRLLSLPSLAERPTSVQKKLPPKCKLARRNCSILTHAHKRLASWKTCQACLSQSRRWIRSLPISATVFGARFTLAGRRSCTVRAIGKRG